MPAASLRDALDTDTLALELGERYDNWAQPGMYDRWDEVYTALYAHKFHRAQPHQSKAVFPKLTQLSDTIRAHLMAMVSPNYRFFEYQATTREDSAKIIRDTALAYGRTKIEQRNFNPLLESQLMDVAITGNMFGTANIETIYTEDDLTGQEILLEHGPTFERINPRAIRFDHTKSIQDSWVLIKTMKSLADIARSLEQRPDLQQAQESWTRLLENRNFVKGLSDSDLRRATTGAVDGLTTWAHSVRDGEDQVEVLEFRGDIWDQETNTLMKNKRIIIWDRQVIAQVSKLPTRGHGVYHCGWRPRPDNAWFQGPFESLMGVQHFTNSLLNSAADAVNFAATPIFKVRGAMDVPSEEELTPGSVLNTGDGDIEVIKMDSGAAINSHRIAVEMMNMMEEFTSVPRQAAGIRTPGERTAFEVAQLNNATNRMFAEVAQRIEIQMVEPLINDALELARKYGDTLDMVRMVGEDKTLRFLQLDALSLGKTGKIRVKGARHHAETQQRLASLMQGIPLLQSLGITTHVDDWKAAEMMSEMLGLDDYGIFIKHAQIYSQAEAASVAQTAQEEALVVANTDIDTPTTEEGG